jgi:hypothetical protein
VQVIEYKRVALKSKFWLRSKRVRTYLYLCVLFTHNLAQSATSTSEDDATGFAPFANATRTYDSNLLNRSKSGSGPAPQSDIIDRFEVGTHVDFQISRQKFSGALSLSDNRHQRFNERNTTGRAHSLRWDSEIGRTLVAAVEGRSVSDQAPIQTGLVSTTRRDQDTAIASLNWKFHPSYSIVNQISKTNTRFRGAENTNEAVLAGLNRDDESSYIGVEYHPGSGSTLALLLKESNGHFPIRQITGPGQSVSNDFDQNETELLGKWIISDLTAVTLSLSSVKREHDEVKSRDFSGTNYRVDVAFKPTVKTNFNLSWGKQIIGISDATNSDALARQLFLSMNMKVTEKVLLKLAYRPQNLQFDGTDGLSNAPRTERVKEGSLSLEYQLQRRVALGMNIQNRSRESTLANADYSANSISIFMKYEH